MEDNQGSNASNSEPSVSSASVGVPAGVAGKGTRMSAATLSLVLGVASIALLVALISISALATALHSFYGWLAVFAVLSAASLICGIKAQRASKRINIQALIGIIIATVFGILTIIIGTYYIKIRAEFNSLTPAASSIY